MAPGPDHRSSHASFRTYKCKRPLSFSGSCPFRCFFFFLFAERFIDGLTFINQTFLCWTNFILQAGERWRGETRAAPPSPSPPTPTTATQHYQPLRLCWPSFQSKCKKGKRWRLAVHTNRAEAGWKQCCVNWVILNTIWCFGDLLPTGQVAHRQRVHMRYVIRLALNMCVAEINNFRWRWPSASGRFDRIHNSFRNGYALVGGAGGGIGVWLRGNSTQRSGLYYITTGGWCLAHANPLFGLGKYVVCALLDTMNTN